MHRNWLLGLVAGSVLILAGCPTPSTWTTPRTIPEGTTNHTIGIEWFTASATVPFDENGDGTIDSGEEHTETATIPFAFPAYVFRIGLADMMDLGVKASTAGTAGVDFKIQLVRSDVFDLAIDPSLQLSILNYANLPIVFGLNAGEAFQFFLGPKFSYAFFFGTVNDTDISYGGALWGGGAGFRIGVADSFAIAPEVNFIRAFEAEGVTLITAGLGFTFGRGQPDYGAPEEPPPAGPPVVQ